MNRSDARAAGRKTYNTGKPCRNGHYADRYVSCAMCVECLKDSAANRARLHNTMMAAQSEGLALFGYRLHPDDHAAALAYCQALDLQRGRIPQTANALDAPPARTGPVQLPELIERSRAQLAQWTPPVAPQLPAEFLRHTQ